MTLFQTSEEGFYYSSTQYTFLKRKPYCAAYFKNYKDSKAGVQLLILVWNDDKGSLSIFDSKMQYPV